MSQSLSRTLNALFVLVVCGILLGAFGVQFVAGELPCPLCLLQRLAMLGVGFGAMLNVVYGSRPRHYGVALASAIFGGIVAGRHILLHILPGSEPYGSAFYGLHLYTWSFLAFVGTGMVLSVMLMFDKPSVEATDGSRTELGLLAKLALSLLIAIAAANFIGALLLCGLGTCPSDPQHYELLTWLR
jgi:disulfide bond formation protein DsbB